MTLTAPRAVPAFVSEALAASNVGTWQSGHDLQHYIADDATAALFGLDATEAAKGLPLANYSRAVHPTDRLLFHDKLDRVMEQGGLFVIEYRTLPRPDHLRWVLARGRYDRDPMTGAMRGRGIVIDITESKFDGQVEDRALFFEPEQASDPLELAADHAIGARRAIDETDEPEGSTLRHAIDTVLWHLGRRLARRGS
jgi:hypothetical protein